MTAALLFGIALIVKPVGNVLFSVLFGSWYRCAGDAVLTVERLEIPLGVYKARNKPFLLVGPYRFDDYEDFFFVNKKQLIGTAVDKGGEAWFRLGKYLFILDDLNHWDVLRVPWWDHLDDPASKNKYDAMKNCRTFTFKIGSSAEKFSLSVPETFFTSDMDGAFNVTMQKQITSAEKR